MPVRLRPGSGQAAWGDPSELFGPIGFTSSGRPVYPIAGANDGPAGGTPSGDQGTQATQGAQGTQGGTSAPSGQQAAGAPDAGAAGDGSEPDEKDPAKLLDLVKKLRAFERGEKLASKVQKQLDDLQSKVTAFENEKLSDTERKDQRIAELEGELSRLKVDAQQATIRSTFQAAAARAGARYPEDVWKLVDLADVTFDETTGQPKNLDELIAKIRTSRPDYFRPGGGMGSADGGVRTPAGQGPDMNALIRQQAGRSA